LIFHRTLFQQLKVWMLVLAASKDIHSSHMVAISVVFWIQMKKKLIAFHQIVFEHCRNL